MNIICPLATHVSSSRLCTIKCLSSVGCDILKCPLTTLSSAACQPALRVIQNRRRQRGAFSATISRQLLSFSEPTNDGFQEPVYSAAGI
jgi:hypothetical protein